MPSDDLFGEPDTGIASPPAAHAPLAGRMRPRSLGEYAGQDHILGPGKLLRRAIEADRFSSIVLYGPPGTGKTSLAEIIARTTNARFERLSGVESTVADLRKVMAAAAVRLARDGTRTILFIDEIHRFNKAQQDVLLPDVERGTVRLIGATTMNPFFYVNSPLVSRSLVFELRPLPATALRTLMDRALADAERGLGDRTIRLDDDAAAHLAEICDGDARRCLNALELAALTTEPGADGTVHLTRAVIEESIQRKAVVYDAKDDAHYDTISAFIKSIRGGDPDAALYWLAKMLHAGEDIRFIARRLVIAASEDIGLADSAGCSWRLPPNRPANSWGSRGADPLAHATVISPRAQSNTAYMGLLAAQSDLRRAAPSPCPTTCATRATRAPSASATAKATYSTIFPTPTSRRPTFRGPRLLHAVGPRRRDTDRGALAHWRALFEAAAAR